MLTAQIRHRHTVLGLLQDRHDLVRHCISISSSESPLPSSRKFYFRTPLNFDGDYPAKAFLNKAIERVRLHRPVTIVTDKAPSYRRVIREINNRYDPHFDSIRHIDKKWRNNLIESDHAAMKRLLGYRQSFRSLRSAKATLSGIETIKRGHIHNKKSGVKGEIEFISQLFGAA